MLGDMPTTKLVSIATGGSDRASILQNQIALLWQWHQNPQLITETNIKTLCPWIQTLRLGPAGVLVTYGELNALPDYLADPVALDTVPANTLLGILQVIRQEGYNQLSLLLNNSNPNVTFQYAASSPWQLSLINNIMETRALDAFTASLGVNGSDHYQGLLSRNACHFAPFSWYRWQASHLIARDLAQRAYASKDSSQKALLAHQALVYDGYADHFLEDSFAAGHLLNKTLVMQWFIEWAAGKSALPVADWDQIQNMTTAHQPGLAGLNLYNPSFAGPSNDPQTAEEAPTFLQRALATGVVPDGLDLGTAYQHYLTWLSSAVTQLASANVHDYYNTNSLWVSSTAQTTPFEVYGDDTLFTGKNGGAGVSATSTTAQLSQQALQDLLKTGKTSVSVESIRQHFPTKAGTSSSGLQDLQTFNTSTLRTFCMNTSFPSLLPQLKDFLLALVSPRLGVSSRDQNLTNVWDASLPSSGYNRVDVTTSAGRMFAGTNGYVYELDPAGGQVLRSLLVTGSVGVGDYTTRVATDGQTLFVGVHGYLYGVSLSTWKTTWSVGVGGTAAYTPVTVLAQSGNLYCASNSYVYQVNPSTGALLHTLQLGSTFGVGNYDTRIVTDGTNLYAGTHGYVYGIPLSTWKAAWNVGVGGTGAYDPVSVLVLNGRLFAGSNGYAYQINPSNGTVLHSLLVTGSIGVGDYTTHLATDGQSLFVGVHGYVYGISIAGGWSGSAWNVSVGGTTGRVFSVTVLARSGRLFAGANGYAYELNPSSGTIISNVLLASPYWVGDFATELASDGQDLLAGTHGYAYKVLVQANATGAQPLWAVNGQATSQNNIYQCAPTWTSVSGYQTGVSAASDGTVWAVNTNLKKPNNNLSRWIGSSWIVMKGWLTQVAVGNASTVWGVDTTIASPASNIRRWNGSDWDEIAGYLTSIAVAADGTVWGVNTNIASPNDNIFRWNGKGWIGVTGYLTSLAVTPGGIVWGVNAQQAAGVNNVYAWTGSSWDLIAGHMTGITAAADGTVLAVNAQQASGTNNIYLWNGVTWDANRRVSDADFSGQLLTDLGRQHPTGDQPGQHVSVRAELEPGGRDIDEYRRRFGWHRLGRQFDAGHNPEQRLPLEWDGLGRDRRLFDADCRGQRVADLGGERHAGHHRQQHLSVEWDGLGRDRRLPDERRGCGRRHRVGRQRQSRDGNQQHLRLERHWLGVGRRVPDQHRRGRGRHGLGRQYNHQEPIQQHLSVERDGLDEHRRVPHGHRRRERWRGVGRKRPGEWRRQQRVPLERHELARRQRAYDPGVRREPGARVAAATYAP